MNFVSNKNNPSPQAASEVERFKLDLAEGTGSFQTVYTGTAHEFTTIKKLTSGARCVPIAHLSEISCSSKKSLKAQGRSRQSSQARPTI